MTHLSSKEPTDTNDAEDVEDGRAHDGSHPHITVGDENTCAQGISQSESTVTPAIWAGGWVGGWVSVAVCVCLPMTDANSSGAELPAAMKVAPATSSLRSSFCRNEAQRRQWSSTVQLQCCLPPSLPQQRHFTHIYVFHLPRRSSPAMSQSTRRR